MFPTMKLFRIRTMPIRSGFLVEAAPIGGKAKLVRSSDRLRGLALAAGVEAARFRCESDLRAVEAAEVQDSAALDVVICDGQVCVVS
jgi:hypothetical protein